MWIWADALFLTGNLSLLKTCSCSEHTDLFKCLGFAQRPSLRPINNRTLRQSISTVFKICRNFKFTNIRLFDFQSRQVNCLYHIASVAALLRVSWSRQGRAQQWLPPSWKHFGFMLGTACPPGLPRLHRKEASRGKPFFFYNSLLEQAS